MKPRENSKVLSLTGGLGNQLFEYVGAATVYGDFNFKIEFSLGITNLNKSGYPELCDYILPRETSLLSLVDTPTKFQKRMTHLILRKSTSARKLPSELLFLPFKLMTTWSLSSYLKGFFKILSCNNLHDYNVKSDDGVNEFLIGFFHSDYWTKSPHVADFLHNLQTRKKDDYLSELEEDANLSRPIILHIRLGDYLKETRFGILPTDYYLSGLDYLLAQKDFSRIWVFTNDVEGARSVFPEKYLPLAKFIPNFSESSSQILEAMRLGSGYVIGNSTFSWWAARLAKNSDALVVAPDPWFQDGETTKDLLPANWTKINPWR